MANLTLKSKLERKSLKGRRRKEARTCVTPFFEVDSELGVFALWRGGLDRSPNIDGRVNYKAALTLLKPGHTWKHGIYQAIDGEIISKLSPNDIQPMP